MKMTHTIAYAIYAVLQLARESAGVPVSCTQLARVGQLPKRFLLQVLRRLVTRGVLQSTRGADGGYYLSRPADQITLRDVFEAFQKPSDLELPIIAGLPMTARTRVAKAMHDMVEAGRQELSRRTLADLIRPPAGGGAEEE